MVTNLLRAPLLIILSDVDGLYDGDPADESSKVISVVDKIDDEVLAVVQQHSVGLGKGGMGSSSKPLGLSPLLVKTSLLPAAVNRAYSRRSSAVRKWGRFCWLKEKPSVRGNAGSHFRRVHMARLPSTLGLIEPSLTRGEVCWQLGFRGLKESSLKAKFCPFSILKATSLRGV